MEADTPQKQTPTSNKNVSPNYRNTKFSMLYDGHKPGFHPRTPSSGSTSSTSILGFMSASILSPPAKRFHLHTTTTQSQHRNQKHITHTITEATTTKIRNPFEAALAERLHLPLIGSPSLFQRPTTPQLSSTQFEWTIDDVSSLKPANVEPHETQFHDSPDPDYEAKAQSAISSFFKEQQIVPSPVNCPLRQHRIILAEINGNTPIAKPGRRIRDYGTQTALTLPPKLPADLEEALRPYFQPHLTVTATAASSTGCEESRMSCSSSVLSLSFNSSSSGGGGGSGSGGHNVSMRRKLFDIHNIIVLDENRKFQTPTSGQLSSPHSCRPAIVGKLSDSLDKSSASLMSPISVSEYFSPVGEQDDNTSEHNNRPPPRRSFLFKSPNSADLSPIYPSPRMNFSCNFRESRKEQSKQETNSSKDFETPAKLSRNRLALTRRRLGAVISDHDDEDEDGNIEIENTKFTPDRSSSPLHSFLSSGGGGGSSGSGATTFATESFHQRISRLAVTSAVKSDIVTTQTQNNLDTTEKNFDGSVTLDIDDDIMQISQLNSNLSSSSINSHCDTPTGKRRSASRKNLSQSFTANIEETSTSSEDEHQISLKKQRHKAIVNDLSKLENIDIVGIAFIEGDDDGSGKHPTDILTNEQQISQQPSVNFYRTDSGFNEMTTSSSSSATALLLLSQQDEPSTSREPFAILKSNSDLSEKQTKTLLSNISEVLDVSMSGCCSTPSKKSPEILKSLTGNFTSKTTPTKFNEFF